MITANRDFLSKSLGLLFDADLLVIKVNGSEGCFYYERISQAEVMIKELLIPERCLAAALKKISELIPAEKYIIRTPPYAENFSAEWYGRSECCGSTVPTESETTPVPDLTARFLLGIAYD